MIRRFRKWRHRRHRARGQRDIHCFICVHERICIVERGGQPSTT